MIVVSELTKMFPVAEGEFLAVDRVSFEVNPGEVYGLLGPNGAGKTTSLRMILGLLPPTSGSAEIGGHHVTEFPNEVKRRIGYASASVGVYPWLTPREMLAYVGDLYDLSTSTTKQRTAELAELLDIGGVLNQRCATLSTGQKQRINLARALLHDPPVMLMDEPTLGLDVVGSNVVFEYISHLRTQNKAVIVCTHRLDEAQRLCDRFGLLHQGRLHHEGTLQELQSSSGFESLTEMFLDLLKNSEESQVTKQVAV